MKKKAIVTVFTAILCLGLTACGKNAIPKMTEDELQAVGEYAAITLMKYDANHRSRLVDVALLEEETSKPVAPALVMPEAEEPIGMKPADDTPVIGQQEASNSYSMEEVMGLPSGVTASFTGQEFCEKYPYGEENDYFAVTPSAGRKLLVLKFALQNAAGQDMDVDLLASGCIYQITVNGDYTRRALTTMLLNDMSTYVGTVPAGGSQEVVLVIETEKERLEEVSSIVLNLRNESKKYTIQLF